MNRTITVVIPAYNASTFLAESIQSVLAQTTTPLEILVVDDGSTDNTREIACSFGPLVHCLSQENQGLSRARNRGIAEARGDWVALLDADDYWLPEKLTRQLERLSAQPSAVACFTQTAYINNAGAVLRQSSTPNLTELTRSLLLYSCVVGPPSAALIRRSTLQDIGLFDPQFSQCADWDMWLRLAEVGVIVYVDEPLVRYRVHDSNMSKNIPLLERDTFAVLDKFFRTHPQMHSKTFENNCRSNHWMILAGSYFHAHCVKDCLRCLMSGLRSNPLNLIRPLGMPARWLRRRIFS